MSIIEAGSTMKAEQIKKAPLLAIIIAVSLRSVSDLAIMNSLMGGKKG